MTGGGIGLHEQRRSSTPPLHAKIPQRLSDGDHRELNRGTLEGAGRDRIALNGGTSRCW